MENELELTHAVFRSGPVILFMDYRYIVHFNMRIITAPSLIPW